MFTCVALCPDCTTSVDVSVRRFPDEFALESCGPEKYLVLPKVDESPLVHSRPESNNWEVGFLFPCSLLNQKQFSLSSPTLVQDLLLQWSEFLDYSWSFLLFLYLQLTWAQFWHRVSLIPGARFSSWRQQWFAMFRMIIVMAKVIVIAYATYTYIWRGILMKMTYIL